MGIGEDGVLEPDLVKRSEILGPSWMPAPLRNSSLLEDAHRKALAGERVAGRQPADAAAGNENGLSASVLAHVQFSGYHSAPAHRAAKSIAWTRNPMQMQRVRMSCAKPAKHGRPLGGGFSFVISGGGVGPALKGVCRGCGARGP
jgi:hypothetical protein